MSPAAGSACGVCPRTNPGNKGNPIKNWCRSATVTSWGNRRSGKVQRGSCGGVNGSSELNQGACQWATGQAAWANPRYNVQNQINAGQPRQQPQTGNRNVQCNAGPATNVTNNNKSTNNRKPATMYNRNCPARWGWQLGKSSGKKLAKRAGYANV